MVTAFAPVAPLRPLRSRDYAALRPVMRHLVWANHEEGLPKASTRNDEGVPCAERTERSDVSEQVCYECRDCKGPDRAPVIAPTIFDYTGKSRLTTYLKASVAPSLMFWQMCALLPHHLPME
jgi:hypothetical protein